MTQAGSPPQSSPENRCGHPEHHGPGQGRGVRLDGHRHGIHGLPAVFARRGDRLQQDLLPQRQPGDRPDRRIRHLRRRLRRPAGRRDLLRPDGRPDRPQEGPVHHDRPDGRVHHADRRPAHLRHRRHLGTDPAGRAAAGPGLRRRRRDRRRHRDARRVRTDEAAEASSPRWSASAPTPAPWPRPPSGRCCSACSPRNSCSAGAGGFRSCSASSCWASRSGCGPTSRRARSSRNAPTSSTVWP